MRHSTYICAALVLVCLSCRDGRGATGAVTPTDRGSNRAVIAAPTGEAFDEANEVVETARILAIGVAPLGPTVIRGFALPTYTELPGLSYAQMLKRIASIGATHVSVVTSWDQQTIYHNRIGPNRDTTPSDAVLGAVIDDAHALGLKTLVFPIIHVERRDEGEWRGRLAPTHLERWRESYRAFILHHADLAARHNAEILSVGSELSSQESDTEFWTTLIADVRARFGGKLIYSANWDHYTHPKFWGELDYVGVSSYFEVARRNDEPIFRVTERWTQHSRQMTEFAASTTKPLLLTEVGYPAIDSAAVKPWDYTARTPPNPNAQLAAFQSLATAWGAYANDPGVFAGLFVWHGWGHGGPDDISYPIWGKSSEKLIQRWYEAR